MAGWSPVNLHIQNMSNLDTTWLKSSAVHSRVLILSYEWHSNYSGMEWKGQSKSPHTRRRKIKIQKRWIGAVGQNQHRWRSGGYIIRNVTLTVQKYAYLVIRPHAISDGTGDLLFSFLVLYRIQLHLLRIGLKKTQWIVWCAHHALLTCIRLNMPTTHLNNLLLKNWYLRWLRGYYISWTMKQNFSKS